MNKLISSTILVFLLLAQYSYANYSSPVSDTANPIKPIKIGVFAPLYLDSAFSSGGFYNYGNQFPRFTIPGYEFMTGCKMAVAEMAKQGKKIEIVFIDSHGSYFKKIFGNPTWKNKLSDTSVPQNMSTGTIKQNELLDDKLNQCQVFISMDKDNDFLKEVKFARQHQAVFLSSSFPSNAGITNYPNLFIFNGTMKASSQAICQQISKVSNANILVLSRKGNRDERALTYFKNEFTSLNNSVQYINIDSTFSALKYLDSTKKNVLIAASFSEEFAFTLSAGLNTIISKSYDITLWGMPNWDVFRSSSATGVKMYPYNYTSAYHYAKNDSTYNNLYTKYVYQQQGNPGDHLFKGYEVTKLATQIDAAASSESIAATLNEKGQSLFSKVSFEQTSVSNNPSIDFYENKHLFLMRKSGGVIKKL